MFGLTREQSNNLYDEVLEDHDAIVARELCQKDLFFLLTRACKRRDIDRDWLYDRCREVEANPNGFLDLWAREHYKSTIITFGKSIQDLLIDPNTTIGIFSHTRLIAKGFLDQIKRELETNQFLKDLFPDVLFSDPKSEAPKWSLDRGLIVKRSINPKESSIEAWGLVDGQPTSKHFSILVYDDVVTRESVTTSEQINKVTQAWELSLNLGSAGGKKRYIGTRYHANDTYQTMMNRGSVIARIKPATRDGTMEGDPVFLSKEELLEKRRDQGPYTFGTQMLQNPVSDKAMGFKTEWLKYYDHLDNTDGWNLFILADPASKKKDSSDYTVMTVIGLSPDNNYYLIDAFRDRLNLTQRAAKLFALHRKHTPSGVGYERYGMQSDIEHFEYEMDRQNYRFNITELKGHVSKVDRIQKLVPIFEQRRFFIPRTLMFTDYEGRTQDFIQLFINEEYSCFPVSVHDDMLDCMARILDPDLGAEFPKPKPAIKINPYASSGSWMG